MAMDARQLNLDCDQDAVSLWRVYCSNTRIVLSENKPTAEAAWASAADKLAETLSEIRRTACID